jgi:hypothetical protein
VSYIPREPFADAIVAYASHRSVDLKKRLHGSRVSHLSQSTLYSNRTEWEALRYLSDDAREVYFAIVAQREGSKEAEELRANYERIDRKDGVTIVLETSDDDPFQITAHMQDPIADAWADAHGSLDGGTWECCDGPDFVYDILYWRPGLIEELQAEGYNFDCSQLYEPGEEETAIARHSGECDECQGDYRQAEEHVSKLAANA